MFSNSPQLMAKSFMANLQSSLDSTYKMRISIFGRWWGLYWHNMDKYKLFLLVLLPRILTCINIKLFLPVLLPRYILNYSQNWKQCTLMKLITEMTCHNSHIQNALQCNSRRQFLLGRQVHTTTCYPTLKNVIKKMLSTLGCPFHNFSSHT